MLYTKTKMIRYHFYVQLKVFLVPCSQTSLQNDILKEIKDEDTFHDKIANKLWRSQGDSILFLK